MPRLNPGKIEVELKAWLHNPRETRKKVEKLAKFVEELSEEDIYFTFAGTKGYQKKRFRLRKVKGKSIVTVKIPTGAGRRAEANREFEFLVSDPEAFKVFCQQFGFRVLIEKQKKVRRYSFRPKKSEFNRPVTIEINKVRNLGDFLEIETMVDRKNQVPKASLFLKALLQKLEIPVSKIEPVPYTEMLYNK